MLTNAKTYLLMQPCHFNFLICRFKLLCRTVFTWDSNHSFFLHFLHSLPLWLCRIMVYVLLCCWGVFPVLTLYSPRSIVWGLFFFSPHFPHVYAVFFFNSTCISLLIILCMIVCVTNNKEPNKEPWTGIPRLLSTSPYKLTVYENPYEAGYVWC